MEVNSDLPIEVVAANLSGSHWKIGRVLYGEQLST